MGGFDPLDISSSQMLTATLISVPLIMVFAGISLSGVNWQGFSALLYSAIIGTLLGVIAYNLCIHRFGAMTAAMTQYVVPIVAGIGGVLFLGERITLIMLLGVVLIISGITIIRR